MRCLSLVPVAGGWQDGVVFGRFRFFPLSSVVRFRRIALLVQFRLFTVIGQCAVPVTYSDALSGRVQI